MARRTRLVCTAASVALASSLLLPNLGIRSLEGDEGTYAAAALESNQASVVLPLQLHGRPFVNKPPLYLTLLRGSLALGGADEVSARLPSALAGIATISVLALWLAVHRGCATGLLGALLLATTPGLLAQSGWHGFRSGTTDATLMLLVVLAMLALLRSLVAESGFAPLGAAAALVAATLTKGLAAALFVVPPAAVTALRAPHAADAQRAARRRLVLALAIAACLLPFLLWLACVESWLPGQSLARLVERDIWRRGTVGLNPRQVEGPFFYLRQIVSDFGLPVLALGGCALLAWRNRGRPTIPVLWLLLWATLPVVLASCAASKLPWYIYPAYPAWAAVAALGAYELHATCRRYSKALAGLLVVAIALVAGWRVVRAYELLDSGAKPLGLRIVAGFIDERPEARLYWEPSLRFGQEGLTGGSYFYFLSLGRRVAPWVPPAVASECALVLAQPSREEAQTRAEAGEPISALPRPHEVYPELYLVDRCGGALARQLRSAAAADDPIVESRAP